MENHLKLVPAAAERTFERNDEGEIHDRVTLTNHVGHKATATAISDRGDRHVSILLYAGSLDLAMHVRADDAEELGRLLIAAAADARIAPVE